MVEFDDFENATEANLNAFMYMYHDVVNGHEIRPRGQLVKEVEDYSLHLNMNGCVLTNFKARKLNLNYAKAEFLWYLRGDKYDTFIEKYATMWPKLKQNGGFYYSNYGQYLFGEGQVAWVLDELLRDKDSRRASCVMLKNHHMFPDNKDMVCTYAMNFRIRNNRLNMSVHMRSNDVIFGTTNDVFSFAMTYELVYGYLRHKKYGELKRGSYAHNVDSLHAYERHFDMISEILTEGYDGYQVIKTPEVETLQEGEFMIEYHMHKGNYPKVPEHYPLMRWLTDLP